MIFLPLVYPELFERFHIAPPRGVLFYGPPGECRVWVGGWVGGFMGLASRVLLQSVAGRQGTHEQLLLSECQAVQARARRWWRVRWRPTPAVPARRWVVVLGCSPECHCWPAVPSVTAGLLLGRKARTTSSLLARLALAHLWTA